MDRVSPPKPSEQHEGHSGVTGWLEDNVLVPAVNGSGVLQIYNNFTSKPIELHQEKGNWAVQTLSSAAGAIIPMVVAGKVLGAGMRNAGEAAGLTGGLAKFMASEGVAQTIGASLYEAAKKPNEGETRLGNSLATAVSFAVYEKGNSLLGTRALADNAIANTALRGAFRFGVGSAGGLASYDVSHDVSSLLGVQSQTNWHDRITAMASGGFINVALPVVQQGISKGVNSLMSMREGYRGEPASRLLNDAQFDHPEIRKAIDENPFARFKRVYGEDAQSAALVGKNSMQLAEGDGAPEAAHELTHLSEAKQTESVYQNIAKTLEANPEKAEADYYLAREMSELKARQAENSVAARVDGKAAATTDLGNQLASGQRVYRTVWADDFAKFKADPKYRPVEYGGEAGDASVKAAATGTTTEQAATVKADVAQPGTYKVSPGVTEPRGAWVVDADDYQKFVAARAAEGNPVTPGEDVHVPPQEGTNAEGKTGINFAVFSENAKSMHVLLFADAKDTVPSQVVPLTRGEGNVWNAFVEGAPEYQKYLTAADGTWDPDHGYLFNPKMGLIEPWTKATTGDTPRPVAYDDSQPMDFDKYKRMAAEGSIETMPKSIAMSDKFDWQGDKPLNHPPEEMQHYEISVKGFTAGDASLGPKAGKWAGLVEKIPFLKRMGYTDVEFEPIAESDAKLILTDDKTLETRTVNDQWRYNATAFMAPDGDLAMDPTNGGQVHEMKWAIRELHKENIGAILDKVFNHTTEYGKYGPTVSFKGLDNKVYYMLNPTNAEYVDHTGCGNTLNVNHPEVRKMILDTLRYYVKEFHVDGFRFDLASVFNYDVDNVDKPKTPIISEIENDPILKYTKLIPEPWSTTNYKLGHFSDKRWGEWNGRFRDNLRQYVRGDNAQIQELAERIAGSPQWYDRSQGRFSVNMDFIHDGQKAYDATMYTEKHNLENGEGNRDGTGDNFSANYGVEGPTDDPQIQALRERQVKNFAAIKNLSLGVPITHAGDEMLDTANGNNNYWQNAKYNTIDWSLVDKNKGMVDYRANVNHYRAGADIGYRTAEDIIWHLPDGSAPQPHDWQNPDAHFIGWQFKPTAKNPNAIYNASNMWWGGNIDLKLPEGYNWRRVIDTNLPYGQDAVPLNQATPLGGRDYTMKPRSVVSFIGEPLSPEFAYKPDAQK